MCRYTPPDRNILGGPGINELPGCIYIYIYIYVGTLHTHTHIYIYPGNSFIPGPPKILRSGA